MGKSEVPNVETGLAGCISRGGPENRSPPPLNVIFYSGRFRAHPTGELNCRLHGGDNVPTSNTTLTLNTRSDLLLKIFTRIRLSN